MKTSNKILLALFVLPFVVITLLAFSVYSSYKNGKYITQEQYEREIKVANTTTSFNGINLQSYKGYVNINKADSFAVVVYKWDKDKITYDVKDGNLVLSSKNPNDYIPVTILCPAVSSVTIGSTGVTLSDALKNGSVIAKAESDININGDIDSLTLNIEKNAQVNVGDSKIQKLQLQVADGGRFISNNATIGEFGTVAIADSAIINMGGKTLKSFIDQKAVNKQ